MLIINASKIEISLKAAENICAFFDLFMPQAHAVVSTTKQFDLTLIRMKIDNNSQEIKGISLDHSNKL
jgi:hypothetical protein